MTGPWSKLFFSRRAWISWVVLVVMGLLVLGALVSKVWAPKSSFPPYTILSPEALTINEAAATLTWVPGANHEVSIQLCPDAIQSAACVVIAKGEGDSGNSTVVIPSSILSGNYYARVIPTDSNYALNNLTAQPKRLSINVGQPFAAGTDFTVYWQTSGDYERVRIMYCDEQTTDVEQCAVLVPETAHTGSLAVEVHDAKNSAVWPLSVARAVGPVSIPRPKGPGTVVVIPLNATGQPTKPALPTVVNAGNLNPNIVQLLQQAVPANGQTSGQVAIMTEAGPYLPPVLPEVQAVAEDPLPQLITNAESVVGGQCPDLAIDVPTSVTIQEDAPVPPITVTVTSSGDVVRDSITLDDDLSLSTLTLSQAVLSSLRSFLLAKPPSDASLTTLSPVCTTTPRMNFLEYGRFDFRSVAPDDYNRGSGPATCEYKDDLHANVCSYRRPSTLTDAQGIIAAGCAGFIGQTDPAPIEYCENKLECANQRFKQFLSSDDFVPKLQVLLDSNFAFAPETLSRANGETAVYPAASLQKNMPVYADWHRRAPLTTAEKFTLLKYVNVDKNVSQNDLLPTVVDASINFSADHFERWLKTRSEVAEQLRNLINTIKQPATPTSFPSKQEAESAVKQHFASEQDKLLQPSVVDEATRRLQFQASQQNTARVVPGTSLECSGADQFIKRIDAIANARIGGYAIVTREEKLTETIALLKKRSLEAFLGDSTCRDAYGAENTGGRICTLTQYVNRGATLLAEPKTGSRFMRWAAPTNVSNAGKVGCPCSDESVCLVPKEKLSEKDVQCTAKFQELLGPDDPAGCQLPPLADNVLLGAHWNFNENSGNYANDSFQPDGSPARRSLRGTFMGRAGWTKWAAGRPQSGSGVDIKHERGGVQVGPTGSKFVSPHNATDASLTLSVWIYPKQVPRGGTSMSILSKAGHYQLDFTADRKIDAQMFDYADVGTPQERIVSQTRVVSDRELERNDWHHIVYTHSKADNTSRLYIDGQKAGEGEDTVMGFTTSTRATPLYIGNDPALASGFIGVIDDVQIYPAVVPLSDALNLYTGNCPKWYPPADPATIDTIDGLWETQGDLKLRVRLTESANGRVTLKLDPEPQSVSFGPGQIEQVLGIEGSFTRKSVAGKVSYTTTDIVIYGNRIIGGTIIPRHRSNIVVGTDATLTGDTLTFKINKNISNSIEVTWTRISQ